MRISIGTTLAATCILACTETAHAQPEYTIVDMGTIDPGDAGVQGFAVSENGNATGRTLGVSNQAFSWSESGGLVPLANEPSRPFGRGNGINNTGTVVGTGATTFFGSSPIPLIWNAGISSQLPLPAGQTSGRANDISSTGTAVGSVGGGSGEIGVIYAAGIATIITQAAPDGSTIRTAFAINDAGLVVGSTMQNQGSGTPFIWTQAGGMVEIPLPPATSSASARGVNSDGLAVGNAGGVFAVPFFYDGTNTYALQDLIPTGTGWDLSMNTSSSAEGISETGIIVGTGVFNGDTHAYAMIPAATCLPDVNHDGMVTPTDFTAWINAFNNNLPECDQNGDGVCTPTDFTAWIANFNAGCP